MLSTEELMKPRIKVIAPMPLMKNEVGSFLERIDYKHDFSFGILTNDGLHFYDYEDFKKWPHIFKDCLWWEDRQESEMPEYVKCIKTPDQIHFPDRIYQLRILNGMLYDTKGFHVILSTNCYLPSTEEEFKNQKQ